jgi:hypothetical protein
LCTSRQAVHVNFAKDFETRFTTVAHHPPAAWQSHDLIHRKQSMTDEGLDATTISFGQNVQLEG